MILIYAFSNQWGTNISRRTLLELQKLISPFRQGEMSRSDRGVLTSKNKLDIKFQLIHSYPQEFFIKYIQGNQYDFIIGLGDHPSDKIRIETQTKKDLKPIKGFTFSFGLNIPLSW